jgi:hypothetical protein
MTWALLVAMGLATGVLSGLFGIGGGLLIVPLLSFLGWPLPQAIGTSMVYVTAVGVRGAFSHYRTKNLDLGFVGTFAAGSVLGAPLGAYLSAILPGPALALGFAAFLAFNAWRMAGAPVQEEAARRAPPVAPTVALGLGVGALSGLFGVGGGLIFVPVQVRSFGIPIKRAVANSLAAIVLTGLAGVIGHFALGHVAWREGLVLVAGGMLGVQLGTRLLAKIPAARLKRLLVGFIVLVAAAMAWRGLAPYWPRSAAQLVASPDLSRQLRLARGGRGCPSGREWENTRPKALPHPEPDPAQ